VARYVLSMVLIVFALTSCSTNQTPKSCRQQSQIFWSRTSDLMTEWQDAFTLARSSTPLTLTPIVRDMQAIRRKVADIYAPPCADRAKTLMLEAMNLEIEALTYCLNPDTCYAMPAHLENANRAWTQANQAALDLK
jgi:hypothetical protein